MANTNPARGMRDFLPADIRKRNYVIGIIKEVYEKYGFEPLETPTIENLDTLTNKYGEEGDQLMFKILKRGEKLRRELSEGNIKNENELTDLALRYDLTVPLARVVANYKNDLPKFFKRYQIQPVWRADRPARGRYREFYQCAVDAIGSTSMITEAELISAVCEILQKLGFHDFTVRINHRNILGGMMEMAKIPNEKRSQTLVIIDKLDKIGLNGIRTELLANDLPEESVRAITHQIENQINLLRRETNNYEYNLRILSETSSPAEEFASHNETMKSYWDAKRDLQQIVEHTKISAARNHIKIDESLARGLSYYTGAIFEINVSDLSGSLGGGGRYDGLIGMFGKEQIPAVGFSLGLERILLIMEERGMFPDDLQANSADVMITLWNEESKGESLKLAAELRAEGLRVLVYPEADKLGKQFKYADSINIPFVCILGENEVAENKVSVKNLKTGEQETVSRNEITEKIKR
jgi:histidyl-tRNA synthetase